MNRLPIFLSLAGKNCLVVGGGAVAERKVRLLLRTGARVTVVAPEIHAALQRQVDGGDVTYVRRPYSNKCIGSCWLVIAATSDEELNRQVAADAERIGRLCNVVDDNAASTFILPAIVDRSPVVIAIGTDGNAPVLARQLKSRIERWLPQRIGELAAQAGRWRALVRKRHASLQDRRRFWQSFFSGPIAEHLLAGRKREAEQAMRAELVCKIEDATSPVGEAWIVGAGPGDPGLLTLRAQELLGRADVVLYDRLVAKTILDFARKEAELVFVGKRAGASAMSQDQINALLVKRVRAGLHVCRLKGGDPFIFGRGGEEAQALAAAGLPFQIVPGITAAIGSAAYAGIPLTLRGVSGSVTLATAKLDRGSEPDWARIIQAGDTLALYMGSSSVGEIRQQLLANGVTAETPVAFVENGTTDEQRTLLCDVASMGETATSEYLSSPSVIYIGSAVAAARELQWFDGRAHHSGAQRFDVDLDRENVAVASM